MTLSAGTRLGPYEILTPLGAGGMGEVYRAKDPRLGRDVAIKVLPASFSSDPDRLKRFEQEARAAGLLNHPNITAVYDIGAHDGSLYVVQELLEGETLRSRIATGALSPRKATEYAIQVAQGLAAAHEKGIVHRDLKPENLFITDDGRVKILDFGLAKLIRPEAGASGQQTSIPTASLGTEPGIVMGTVGYMSPEQVKGLAADHRSDIFSFGTILYEMLSGQRAFRGDSTVETMSAILKEDPPELSQTNKNVSPGLERLVRHCLEKNPEQRFHSAHDIAFALEALSGTSGVAAAMPGKRRPAWLRVAGIASLGGLLAVASFLAGRGQKRPDESSRMRFTPKTFDGQLIWSARFAPDGRSIVYSTASEWHTPQILTIGAEYPEPRSLGLANMLLLSVSSKGELAVLLKPINWGATWWGTLASVPLGGGAPREILEGVREADWSPDGSNLAVVRIVGGGLDQLEYPIGKVLWKGPGYLSNLRISPKGDRIAFFQHPIRYEPSGEVVVVDLAGKRTALSEGFWLSGLAWAPGGNELLFAASTEVNQPLEAIAVTLSGERRRAMTNLGSLIARDVSRDGRWLLERVDLSDSLVAGRLGDPAERDLSWLDSGSYPQLSGDGRRVFFSDWGGSFFVRGIEGSPVIRLGEGTVVSISRDGSRALSIVPLKPAEVRVYPTGPGTFRTLPRGNLESYADASFLDDRSVVLSAHEPGRPYRCYVQLIDAGAPKPVTPEGYRGCRPSPDGKLLFVVTGNFETTVVPTAGGAPRTLGNYADASLSRWSPDGKAIWMYDSRELPIRLFRLDIETSRREPMGEIMPRDRTGLIGVGNVSLADDGETFVYNLGRGHSQLFVGEVKP